ncbi:MAG TPA: serine/threonine-protein kinase, partial [Polyangiaceae bacterium]
MGELALQPGDVLAGRYRLRRILGTGGMGAIWEAYNEATDRGFAIKLLHPTAARDPIIMQRFLQEAKAAGRLRHPAIIEVYDMGTESNVPYMVMELLTGESLEERLRREGKLPVETALRFVKACAEGLVVAHAQGIVHRDLKPGNIFLHVSSANADPVPKILDFGISKVTDPDRDIGLTISGVILGTPSYMSPEQYRADEHLDGRSDIWSLGVVLCKCLTGQSPFASRRFEEIAVEVVRAERLDLAKVTADLPANVATIIERCLEKDRDKRFSSAHELAEACARALLVKEPPRKFVAPAFVVPPAFSPPKPNKPRRA